jgi:hypothetical protein
MIWGASVNGYTAWHAAQCTLDLLLVRVDTPTVPVHAYPMCRQQLQRGVAINAHPNALQQPERSAVQVQNECV